MIFNIKVKGRIATYIPGDEEAVCGNDGDQIKFELDEEWAAINPKTARFKYGTEHHDVEFTGDTCTVPYLEGVNKVYVGLYSGEKGAAEPRHSTTDTMIPYKYSSRCGASTPAPASGENYTNEAKGAAAEAKAAAQEATAAAETIGELKNDVTINSIRISQLEREVSGAEITIKNNNAAATQIGMGAEYVTMMIHILGSNSVTVQDEDDYNAEFDMYGEKQSPRYQTGFHVPGQYEHVISLPSAERMQEICPSLGYGQHWYNGKPASFVSDNVSKYANFIFFEAGKAYYYQGAEYRVCAYDSLSEDEKERIVGSWYAWDGTANKFLIGLREPMVTDISEHIRYHESEMDNAGKLFDGYYYVSGNIDSNNVGIYLNDSCFCEVIY